MACPQPGFLSRDHAGLVYQYGYRIYEEEHFKFPSVKEFRIKSNKDTCPSGNLVRLPVSSTLPIYWTDSVRPRPDHRDPLNLVCGIVKRFGNKPTLPDKEIWADLKRFAELFNRHYFKPLTPDQEPTFEEWLKTSPYDENRKTQLREAKAASGLNKGNRRQRRKTFKTNKSFCKDEGYDQFKKPRLINSRVDDAKVEFGPWFDAIAKQVFALPPFIKYIPFSERPEVIKRDLMKEGATYVADDYEAYEAHFDKLHMQLEMGLYKYLTSKTAAGRAWFKEMKAALTGENICTFQHFKVFIEATRMSGEMNTSLGNSYVNLIIHAYWFWVNNGRPTDSSILRNYIFNNIKVEGDDSAASYLNKAHIPTEEQMTKTGFKVEHLEYDNLGDMSFCGCVFDPEDMITCANPLKVLSSFGWVPRRYVRCGPKMRLELMRAKALSYKYQYNGCPIITPFVDNILRRTSHIKIRASIVNTTSIYERELLQAALSVSTTTKPTPWNTRLLVERLYGITIQQQLATEMRLVSVSGPFQLPELNHLIPKEWTRTARYYTSDYYDGSFICELPLGTAAETLQKLKGVEGVTEKTFKDFTIEKHNYNLPTSACVQANDAAWTLQKGR